MRKKLLGVIVVIGMLSIVCVGCGARRENANNASQTATQIVESSKPNDISKTKEAEATEKPIAKTADIKTILVGSSSVKVSIGQSMEEVIAALGEPSIKEKAEIWEADGNYHQSIIYAKEGIKISFTKYEGTFKAAIITIDSSSKAKTSADIVIGSTKDEILSAYKGLIEDSNQDNNLVVVGSVYDGITFSMDKDVVTNIVVGAAQE